MTWSLALLLILSIGPASAEESTTTVTFTDFQDLSALTLSGSTYWNNRTPVQYGGQYVLRLTTGLNQAGGAFLTNPIPLSGAEGFKASFSTAFKFQITRPVGCTDTDRVQGADGLVFVVQTQSNRYGGYGVGIGYSGIPKSVGIEFDTWNNGYIDRNNGNHVGIDLNGNINSAAFTPVQPAMNNGAVWNAWVDYDGNSKRLEVRLSTNDMRPETATLAHTVDLPAVLGTPQAYVGFTSGTGCAGGDHDIRSWIFTNTFNPIGADSTPPVIEPVLGGTLGNNGWFVSDVSLSWNVTDLESPVTALSGCDPAAVTADTAGATFTCTATSGGGTSTGSVTIKRDTSPPTITDLEPPPDTYTNDNQPELSAMVADTGSGIDPGSIVLKLDGQVLAHTVTPIEVRPDGVMVRGKVSAGEQVDLGYLPDGSYSITVTAYDPAGNTITVSWTFIVDATPPQTTATVSPAANAAGWNNGDVDVTFNAIDTLSGVKEITYGLSGAQTGGATTAGATASITVKAEGVTTITYFARDNVGNTEAVKSLILKIDRTAPEVTYTGNNSTYTVDQSVAISCSAADSLSGVAESTCAGINGPAYSFQLGVKTYSATALDLAGNIGNGSVSFQVIADSAGVCNLVNRFVPQKGIANSLCSKLKNAAAAGGKDNLQAKAGLIDAFIKEVNAQAGKAVSRENAAILKWVALAL
ncbi:MAG: hypothetical protein HYY09_03905 [Firmicutes bacterium]|nr:hypothetical protein [Bacillota bacterium]